MHITENIHSHKAPVQGWADGVISHYLTTITSYLAGSMLFTSIAQALKAIPGMTT